MTQQRLMGLAAATGLDAPMWAQPGTAVVEVVYPDRRLIPSQILRATIVRVDAGDWGPTALVAPPEGTERAGHVSYRLDRDEVGRWVEHEHSARRSWVRLHPAASTEAAEAAMLLEVGRLATEAETCLGAFLVSSDRATFDPAILHEAARLLDEARGFFATRAAA